MKICPVCNSASFDDMDICFGCMHRFTPDDAKKAASARDAEQGSAPMPSASPPWGDDGMGAEAELRTPTSGGGDGPPAQSERPAADGHGAQGAPEGGFGSFDGPGSPQPQPTPQPLAVAPRADDGMGTEAELRTPTRDGGDGPPAQSERPAADGRSAQGIPEGGFGRFDGPGSSQLQPTSQSQSQSQVVVLGEDGQAGSAGLPQPRRQPRTASPRKEHSDNVASQACEDVQDGYACMAKRGKRADADTQGTEGGAPMHGSSTGGSGRSQRGCGGTSALGQDAQAECGQVPEQRQIGLHARDPHEDCERKALLPRVAGSSARILRSSASDVARVAYSPRRRGAHAMELDARGAGGFLRTSVPVELPSSTARYKLVISVEPIGNRV